MIDMTIVSILILEYENTIINWNISYLDIKIIEYRYIK